MYLREIGLGIFDIEEKDVIYRNENVLMPIKATKVFLPHKTSKPVRLFFKLLSKMHLAKERKDYVAPRSITAYTGRVHGRSAAIPVRFRDKYGNAYNWLNFKGIGRTAQGGFKKRIKLRSLFSKTGRREDDFGILTLGHANRDRANADKLLQRGLRTSPVLFVIELRQLPGKDGKLHPVEELIPKSRNLEDKPVVIIRGMRNFLRLWDVCDAERQDRGLLIKKAIECVNREGATKIKDRRGYFFWLASTVAEQLSILYSARAYHEYINGHNITLAGEIIDLGSMVSHQLIDGDAEVSLAGIWLDVQRGFWALYDFAEFVCLEECREDALRLFLHRYLECVVEDRLKAEASGLKPGIIAFCDGLPLKDAKNSISEDAIHQKSLELAKGLFLAINEGYPPAKKFLERSSK